MTMKLILEIAVILPDTDTDLGHILTQPFEYESATKLEATLKRRTEKLLKLNGTATSDDYCFQHEGYELDLRKLVFDGKYEAPDIKTVHEYFKSHHKGVQ